MDKLLAQRFDMVMANLKPIEPSDGFEFEFGRRLRESALTIREKGVIARAVKLMLDNLRYNLLPQTPVLVRVAVSFVFVFSIGLYIYGIQPMRPVIMSQGRVITERVSAGSVIMTGSGESIDIVLADRYMVRLKENARIKIAKLTPRFGHGIAAFKLTGGTALVDVEKGFKGSKFVVDTEAGRAIALGTKFAVDVSRDHTAKTAVSVLEGRVKVTSAYKPKRMRLAKNTVLVGAGQKTEMSTRSVPIPPERLMAAEWQKLEELYQIGKKPQVMLLLKNTPDRVRQLLKPCPLYIVDEKPREIPQILDDAVRSIEAALKTGDGTKHLEAIRLLEKVTNEYPNPKYSPQLLLYIGSYYEYMSQHSEAIKSFERVVAEYPLSPFASLGQAAIGVIYKEEVGNQAKGDEAFKKVLKNYPDTPEAIFAEETLGIKKVI